MRMTREEFIKELKAQGYSYEMDGDKLVVTHFGLVDLRYLEALPSGIEFKNKGNVYLNSLQTLPQGIEFKNRGDVNLTSLIGGWFDDWKGNIRGIESNRVLNRMISLGVI